MLKPKDNLRQQIQYEIDKQNKLMKKLEKLPINLISEAFPNGEWGMSWGYNFNFTLPFDFALIQQVKEFMSVQLPEYKQNYENQFVWDESKEAGHFIDFENKEHDEIKFSFRTGRTGTTCVLNPIGEKTVQIFEVVCADGAQEAL